MESQIMPDAYAGCTTLVSAVRAVAGCATQECLDEARLSSTGIGCVVWLGAVPMYWCTANHEDSRPSTSAEKALKSTRKPQPPNRERRKRRNCTRCLPHPRITCSIGDLRLDPGKTASSIRFMSLDRPREIGGSRLRRHGLEAKGLVAGPTVLSGLNGAPIGLPKGQSRRRGRERLKR